MPSNWLSLDTNFPAFTGQESTDEKVKMIQNYMFMLVEQLRYLLRNLDLSNMNKETVGQLTDLTAENILAKNGLFENLIAENSYINNLITTILVSETVITNNLITNNLYADNGSIANLIVNRLRTDYIKAWRYLEGDTSDLNFQDIHDEQRVLITAVVVDKNNPTVEHYTNMDGNLLWWKDGEIGGSMITAVPEGQTGVPVMVYVYKETVKRFDGFREVTMSDGQMTVAPVVIDGAGTGTDSTSGQLHFVKDVEGPRWTYYSGKGSATAAVLEARDDGYWYCNGQQVGTGGGDGGVLTFEEYPTEKQIESIPNHTAFIVADYSVEMPFDIYGANVFYKRVKPPPPPPPLIPPGYDYMFMGNSVTFEVTALAMLEDNHEHYLNMQNRIILDVVELDVTVSENKDYMEMGNSISFVATEV